jgi:hypothetical protein
VLFGLLWVSIGVDKAFLLVAVLLAVGMVGAGVLLRNLRPVASPLRGQPS